MSDRLPQLRLDAEREGWAKWIRTASDEAAVLEGCRFDIAKAKRVEKFGCTLCRHSVGRWDGQPFELLPWQRDEVVYPAFGWVRPDGQRRFRYLDIFVAKKNGKSSLCSMLSLYLLMGDNEPGAEVYAAAVDRYQASIVFNESANMARRSAALTKRLRILDTTKTIVYGLCRYQALSGDNAAAEGKKIHGLICDEVHAWNTPTLRKLFDALYYGGAAREQPMSIVISTAGEHDEDTLWWEIYQRAKAIQRNEAIDTRRLGLVYAADEEDDWTAEETWRKANPSYGHILRAEDMRADCEEAKTSPRKRAAFLRYRLNRPIVSASPWLPVEEWDACDALPQHKPKQECWEGLDMASVSDFTSLVQVFRSPGDWAPGEKEAAEEEARLAKEEGKQALAIVPEDIFDVVPHFWMPEGTIAERAAEGKHVYRQWADGRLLTAIPGPVVIDSWIKTRIVETARQYRLQELGFDAWGAASLAAGLDTQHKITVVKVSQNYSGLSEAMKRLEKLIRLRKIRHGGHPIMRRMFTNVTVKADDAGNIRPVKPKGDTEKKIDGVVALIMAVSRAMLAQPRRLPALKRREAVML